MILSPDDTRLLERLTLGGLASPLASSAGTRRARTRGAGAEFHEYRHYQPGDDPRSIDWTVEARLNQLVVRVSRAEGHLALHLLLDVSASMGIGVPTKLSCAAKAAAALGYLAIEGRDASGLATFSDRIHTCVRPSSGRVQLSRLFDLLEEAAPAGISGMDRALEAYAAVTRGPGLVAVLSDYFDETSSGTGLQALVHRGLTPVVVQIVAPEELEPALAGNTELVDVEDDARAPLVVDPAAVEAYRRRMDEHSDALRSMCRSRGLTWMRIESDTSFKDMLAGFEAAGLFDR